MTLEQSIADLEVATNNFLQTVTNKKQTLDTAVVNVTTDANAADLNRQLVENNALLTGQDVVQTAADRIQTGLDRIATNDDKIATGLDAIQTGLDRTGTGEDRVATGLDRVGTSEDRIQTGLDRIQTGLDVTNSAADANSAIISSVNANLKAGEASGSDAVAKSVLDSVVFQQQYVDTAQAQASLAAGNAANAISVVSPDLSGVNAAALHRSPNAVTAMFVYDTSKDSDGGAWTERCQHTSWYNEPLCGKWLGAQPSEFYARNEGAILGSTLIANWQLAGSWDANTGVVFSGATLEFDAASDRVTKYALLTQGQIYEVKATVACTGVATLYLDNDGGGVGSSISIYGNFNNNTSTIRFIATTTSTRLRLIQEGNGTISLTSFSIKQITTPNTASGDYFQMKTDGKFYSLNKNLLTNTATLATQTQWLIAGTYTLSSTTASTGSVAITGVATASHTAGTQTTFTVASSGNVTFTVTGSVLTAQLEAGTTASVYVASGANRITEVFRGNKAKFPKLSAIVAERSNVTIYDLTEPGRPMFARFLNTSGYAFTGDASVVTASNGAVAIGSNSGLFEVSFPKDSSTQRNATSYYLRNKNLANRNSVATFSDLGSAGKITNSGVNSVAMTVLPDALLDPVTGLAVPTIAVATGGGVSVIKHNGTVVSGGSGAFNTITLAPNLLSAGRADSSWYYAANPGSLGSSFTLSTATGEFGRGNTAMLRNAGRTELVRSSGALVTKRENNESATSKSINATITNTYNTGHLIGDIKRCYLSDITAESVGPSTELVTNGTFDSVSDGETGYDNGDGTVDGWTRYRSFNQGALPLLSVVNNALRITNQADSMRATAQTSFNTIVGKTYFYKLKIKTSRNTNVIVSFSNIANRNIDNWNNTFNAATTTTVTEYSGRFTASAETMYLAINTYASNITTDVDDISIKEIVSDRSYKAQGASIYGTLTKSAVASGSELVAYSGFSADNYLREPYSADLDFGTGEWSVGAWVKVSGSTPLPGNIVNGSDGTGSWGFSTYSLVSQSTGETVSGFGAVTKVLKRVGYGDHSFYRGVATGQVFSFYAKAGEHKIICIGPDASTTYYPNSFFFNLETGTLLSNPYGNKLGWALAPEVGTGWYRFWASAPNGASGIKIFAPNNSYDINHIGDGVSGYFVCGAQLEYGSTPSTFVPTSGGPTILEFPIAERAFSSESVVRLSMDSAAKFRAVASDGTTTRTVTTTAAYNTGTWCKAEAVYKTDGSLAILVNGKEVAVTRGNPLLTLDSRYNLLTKTEQFDDAAWPTKPGITANAAIAPDGTQTADLMYPISSGTFVSQLYRAVSSSGTVSISAKAAGKNFLIFSNAAGTAGAVWFNLSTGSVGTVSSGYSATISSQGNGWYRCSVTLNSGNWSYFDVVAGNADGSNAVTANGTDGIYIWGAQLELGSTARTYQRVTSAAETEVAPLTIGNSYNLDAPFPGSIALLKLSATAPTYDQAAWMYEQEKELFRENAQCCLPDSNAIQDLTYDDKTDSWIAVSTTNESTWTGLVRTSVTPVSAGTYSKVSATSGVKLQARITTNPGVDVTIPPIALKQELIDNFPIVDGPFTFDYVAGFTGNTTINSTALTSVASLNYPSQTTIIGAQVTGSGIPTGTTIIGISGTTIYISNPATATATNVQIKFTDFVLPIGYSALTVRVNGTAQSEGATKAYTRLFDGFRETIRFAVAPAYDAWVQLESQYDK